MCFIALCLPVVEFHKCIFIYFPDLSLNVNRQQN